MRGWRGKEDARRKAFTVMNNLSRITRAPASDWAPHIESAAYKAAPVVVAIITAAILTYEAGGWLRVTLDELNDSLAAVWTSLWGVASEDQSERVDELVLGAMAVSALAWEWLTSKPEDPVAVVAVATPPLLPPPVRQPAKPVADPLRRGSAKK